MTDLMSRDRDKVDLIFRKISSRFRRRIKKPVGSIVKGNRASPRRKIRPGLLSQPGTRLDLRRAFRKLLPARSATIMTSWLTSEIG